MPEQFKVSEQPIPILHVENVVRAMTWYQRWGFNGSESIDLNRDIRRLRRSRVQDRFVPSTARMRT